MQGIMDDIRTQQFPDACPKKWSTDELALSSPTSMRSMDSGFSDSTESGSETQWRRNARANSTTPTDLNVLQHSSYPCRADHRQSVPVAANLYHNVLDHNGFILQSDQGADEKQVYDDTQASCSHELVTRFGATTHTMSPRVKPLPVPRRSQSCARLEPTLEHSSIEDSRLKYATVSSARLSKSLAGGRQVQSAFSALELAERSVSTGSIAGQTALPAAPRDDSDPRAESLLANCRSYACSSPTTTNQPIPSPVLISLLQDRLRKSTLALKSDDRTLNHHQNSPFRHCTWAATCPRRRAASQEVIHPPSSSHRPGVLVNNSVKVWLNWLSRQDKDEEIGQYMQCKPVMEGEDFWSGDSHARAKSALSPSYAHVIIKDILARKSRVSQQLAQINRYVQCGCRANALKTAELVCHVLQAFINSYHLQKTAFVVSASSSMHSTKLVGRLERALRLLVREIGSNAVKTDANRNATMPAIAMVESVFGKLVHSALDTAVQCLLQDLADQPATTVELAVRLRALLSLASAGSRQLSQLLLQHAAVHQLTAALRRLQLVAPAAARPALLRALRALVVLVAHADGVRQMEKARLLECLAELVNDNSTDGKQRLSLAETTSVCAVLCQATRPRVGTIHRLHDIDRYLPIIWQHACDLLATASITISSTNYSQQHNINHRTSTITTQTTARRVKLLASTLMANLCTMAVDLGRCTASQLETSTRLLSHCVLSGAPDSTTIQQQVATVLTSLATGPHTRSSVLNGGGLLALLRLLLLQPTHKPPAVNKDPNTAKVPPTLQKSTSIKEKRMSTGSCSTTTILRDGEITRDHKPIWRSNSASPVVGADTGGASVGGGGSSQCCCSVRHKAAVGVCRLSADQSVVNQLVDDGWLPMLVTQCRATPHCDDARRTALACLSTLRKVASVRSCDVFEPQDAAQLIKPPLIESIQLCANGIH